MQPGARDVRHRLLHELAHAVIEDVGLRMPIEREELAANYLAAAIMAPASQVRRAHAFYGSGFEHIRPIAKAFGLSPTSAEIRLREVVGGESGVATRSGHFITPFFTISQPTVRWPRVRPIHRDATVSIVRRHLEMQGRRTVFGAIDDECIAVRVA